MAAQTTTRTLSYRDATDEQDPGEHDPGATQAEQEHSMTSSSRNYAWLPEHQLEVASTLAHADALIASASDTYSR